MTKIINKYPNFISQQQLKLWNSINSNTKIFDLRMFNNPHKFLLSLQKLFAVRYSTSF
jgi:hypothetical protein